MATTTIAAQKLGKLAVKVDVRTLMLARYIDTAALPKPPASFNESAHVKGWPMYDNDKVGDCTIAAAGHMIEAWTAAATGDAVEVSVEAVLKAFDKVKSVDPQTGEAGAVELDVLNMWRKTGIGGHRIGAYARVSLVDEKQLRAGAWLFGGLYLGLQLPITAQTQDTWEWTGSLKGPAAPGSWGGHAVDAVGYDDHGLTIVTWGALKRMTWSFFSRYCDEAYCLLSTDFLEQGKSPSGFDLEALKDDLELVTA